MIAWLVEAMIASTVLMVAVLFLRHPVARVFGPKVAYALWALPAMRMFLPPLALTPAELTPVNQAMGLSSAPVAALRAQGGLEWSMPFVDSLTSPALLGALAFVWLAGMALFIFVQIVGYRRFCRHMLAGTIRRSEVTPGIALVESTAARGPMAFGIWHRIIVFPADPPVCFRADEQAMALAHELAHHRRGDLIANAVALGLLGLHWCNPVAWVAYRAFRSDQELACDADVLDAAAARGDIEFARQAYGRALVKAASSGRLAAICHLNAVDTLKRRLAMLSDPARSERVRWTGFAVAGLLVAGGLMLTASGRTAAAEVGQRVAAALPSPSAQVLLAIAPPMPPASPASPAPPMPPAPPAVSGDTNVISIDHVRHGGLMQFERDAALAEAAARDAENAATRAEADAHDAAARAEASAEDAMARAEAAMEQAHAIEIEEVAACDRHDQPVTTREDVRIENGKVRRRLRIAICEQAILRQVRVSALASVARHSTRLTNLAIAIRADANSRIHHATARMVADPD